VADSRLALGALWPIGSPAGPTLATAVEAGFGAVHPFVTEVSADLVAQAHEAGLAVNVWTVNATHDLVAFMDLGVDAVITDRLAHALALARGERPDDGAP
jgi:glycerophosphoryl diester phosphodiesterase